MVCVYIMSFLKNKFKNCYCSKMNERKKYYDNGKLKKHYFLNEHNERHGLYRSWCSNGLLKEYCHYKNGKLEGRYMNWDNGYSTYYTKKLYKDGLLHGEYKHKGKYFFKHVVYEHDTPVYIFNEF